MEQYCLNLLSLRLFNWSLNGNFAMFLTSIVSNKTYNTGGVIERIAFLGVI